MVLNIAHRGARSLAPENTLAAARKALEIGADLWETDVSVTTDGQLILMHDDTLDRTTDAPIRFPGRSPWTVSAFTLAEIRDLDAGSWFVETDPFDQIAAGAVTPGEQAAYRGERVPTLRRALEVLNNGHVHRTERLRDLIRGTASPDYARDVAGRYIRGAVGALVGLPVSDARRCLAEMAEFVVARRW